VFSKIISEISSAGKLLLSPETFESRALYLWRSKKV